MTASPPPDRRPPTPLIVDEDVNSPSRLPFHETSLPHLKGLMVRSTPFLGEFRARLATGLEGMGLESPPSSLAANMLSPPPLLDGGAPLMELDSDRLTEAMSWLYDSVQDLQQQGTEAALRVERLEKAPRMGPASVGTASALFDADLSDASPSRLSGIGIDGDDDTSPAGQQKDSNTFETVGGLKGQLQKMKKQVARGLMQLEQRQIADGKLRDMELQSLKTAICQTMGAKDLEAVRVVFAEKLVEAEKKITASIAILGQQLQAETAGDRRRMLTQVESLTSQVEKQIEGSDRKMREQLDRGKRDISEMERRLAAVDSLKAQIEDRIGRSKLMDQENGVRFAKMEESLQEFAERQKLLELMEDRTVSLEDLFKELDDRVDALVRSNARDAQDAQDAQDGGSVGGSTEGPDSADDPASRRRLARASARSSTIRDRTKESPEAPKPQTGEAPESVVGEDLPVQRISVSYPTDSRLEAKPAAAAGGAVPGNIWAAEVDDVLESLRERIGLLESGHLVAEVRKQLVELHTKHGDMHGQLLGIDLRLSQAESGGMSGDRQARDLFEQETKRRLDDTEEGVKDLRDRLDIMQRGVQRSQQDTDHKFVNLHEELEKVVKYLGNPSGEGESRPNTTDTEEGSEVARSQDPLAWLQKRVNKLAERKPLEERLRQIEFTMRPDAWKKLDDLDADFRAINLADLRAVRPEVDECRREQEVFAEDVRRDLQELKCLVGCVEACIPRETRKAVDLFKRAAGADVDVPLSPRAFEVEGKILALRDEMETRLDKAEGKVEDQVRSVSDIVRNLERKQELLESRLQGSAIAGPPSHASSRTGSIAGSDAGAPGPAAGATRRAAGGTGRGRGPSAGPHRGPVAVDKLPGWSPVAPAA